MEQVQEQAAAAAEKKAKNKITEAEQAILTKYPALAVGFLRGSFKGQLDSVYKSHADKPEKSTAFVAAITAGDISLPTEPLTSKQVDKLIAIGLAETAIPEAIRPVKKEAPAAPAAAEEAPAAATEGTDAAPAGDANLADYE